MHLRQYWARIEADFMAMSRIHGPLSCLTHPQESTPDAPARRRCRRAVSLRGQGGPRKGRTGACATRYSLAASTGKGRLGFEQGGGDTACVDFLLLACMGMTVLLVLSPDRMGVGPRN